MAKKTTAKKKSGMTSAQIKQSFKKLMANQKYYLKLDAAKRNYFRQLRSRFKSNALRSETMEAILKKHRAGAR